MRASSRACGVTPVPDRRTAEPTWRSILFAAGAAAAFAASVALRLHTGILDLPVARALNRAAASDGVLASLAAATIQPTVQGTVIVSLAWVSWFTRSSRSRRDRLIIGAAAAAMAAVAAHLVQNVMPPAVKPIFDLSTRITAPPALGDIGFLRATANPLSQSFPSERATLFGGMAVAMFNADRRIGLVALACTLSVELCRVFLSLHYPSDVAGSLFLAGTVVCLADAATPLAIGRAFIAWERTSAPTFYAGAIVASYLVVAC